MKNLVLALLFLCVSFGVKAQDDAFSKDTQNLVEIVSKEAFKPIVQQFSAMVAEDKKAAFTEELNATFPDLYASMAEIYMAEFTHDEIKELLKFYSTPVGKKIADKTSILSQKGMVAGQAWGMKVQEIISKYK